ncbi:MAG: undecaprenyl/decaprenyl-phosphate alpha-N-acetylglucosaminyl 1-phosphate transferase [Spirochaetes bacterium]|nr:undecaprenyl/decaprenyl-phosphate alpha-N-acetylglucosaminyl 1-phosphate transferase [Spirochaetota bacterium]
MNNIILLIIISGIALIINLVVTPFLISLSHKKSWYDITNDRKIHRGNIPRIGGIGIFVSFLLAVFLFVVICKYTDIRLSTISRYHYLALAAGFLIITFLGIADDFFSLKAWQKLLIQITAALIVSVAGFNLEFLYIPFLEQNISFGIFSHLITVFWIISLCNAINLMDGMDGLAGGIAFTASLFYGIIFFMTQNYTAAGLSFALLGAVLGFLVFNFPPAKIFMGDSGSLLLGFSLAVIPLINNSDGGFSQTIFMPLIVLVIPAMDMIAAILRRRRRNLSIASPDREHIHHKLIDFGLSQKKILFVIYSFSILAGLAAFLYSLLEVSKPNSGLPVFAAAWCSCIALFLVLHYKNKARKKKTAQN